MKSVDAIEGFYHTVLIMACFYPGLSSAATAGVFMFPSVEFGLFAIAESPVPTVTSCYNKSERKIRSQKEF